MDFRNQNLANMLAAARKFARVPIVVTCSGLAVLGSMAGGGITAKTSLVFLVVVLLVIHGNSINDLSDYEIDKVNLKNAKDRPLVSGTVTVRQLWLVHAFCGVAAVALSFLFGPVSVAATLAVVLYDYAYSLPPFRLTNRTILSPLTLAAAYTFQPFTLGYASASQPTAYPWLLAIALYLGFVARILLKDFRDVKGDAEFGKQTFLLRYGTKATCAASGVCAFASLIFMCAAVSFSPGVVALLLAGNLAALWLLASLAKTDDLAGQIQHIGVLAKIGNCSILAVLLYYICHSYFPAPAVWTIALPLSLGSLLLYVLWKHYRRDPQIQIA